MSDVREMPARDAKAELLARRTAERKATAERMKAERLARREQYRALCFFSPRTVSMEEEPS